jgi:hypothetical protein
MNEELRFGMSKILHSVAWFPYDERLSGCQWLEQAEREPWQIYKQDLVGCWFAWRSPASAA